MHVNMLKGTFFYAACLGNHTSKKNCSALLRLMHIIAKIMHL